MQVQFLGHASFLASTGGGTRIVCDPWLSGKVFNDSWAHVSACRVPDWSAVDAIWISHEHPDHLHFPTLKGIPAEHRARIEILYQKHASSRVPDALAKFGFARIREIPLYCWVPYRDGEIFVGSVGSMDSFLAIRADGKTLLNLNDCILNESQLRYVKRKIGTIDALFTQFSFANWVGNDSDETGAARRKIESIRLQLRILQPVALVPFASFVYFCNRENARMNAWANHPSKILEIDPKRIQFLYPGDTWSLDLDERASALAAEKYEADFSRAHAIDPTPTGVAPEKLLEAAESMLRKVSSSRSRGFPPLSIYLTDLDRVLTMDFKAGSVRYSQGTAADARYAMCSQAAWYTFAFTWGGGALEVSGMYRDRDFAKGMHPFFAAQNRISTGFLDFSGVRQALQTASFLYAKRGEIFNRFRRRIPDATRLFSRADPWLGHAVALGFLWKLNREILHSHATLWDAKIFHTVAKAVVEGVNPYRMDLLAAHFPNDHEAHALGFFYPPYTLPFFGIFGAFDRDAFLVLWMVLKVLALAWLVRFYRRSAPRVPRALFAWIVFFGLGGALVVDFKTGNVSTFEQFFLWFGLAVFWNERPIPTANGDMWKNLRAGFFTALSGAFKFTLGAFSGVALGLSIRDRAKRMGMVFGIAAAIALLAGFSFASIPNVDRFELWKSWRETVRAQGAIEWSSFARNDTQWGSGHLFSQWFRSAKIGFGLYYVFAAGIVCLWIKTMGTLFLSRRTDSFYPHAQILAQTAADRHRYAIVFAVMTYLLAVPRLKDYSVLLAIVPLLWLLQNLERKTWGYRLLVFLAIWSGVRDFSPDRYPILQAIHHSVKVLTLAYAWLLLYAHAKRLRTSTSETPSPARA